MKGKIHARAAGLTAVEMRFTFRIMYADLFLKHPVTTCIYNEMFTSTEHLDGRCEKLPVLTKRQAGLVHSGKSLLCGLIPTWRHRALAE